MRDDRVEELSAIDRLGTRGVEDVLQQQLLQQARRVDSIHRVVSNIPVEIHPADKPRLVALREATGGGIEVPGAHELQTVPVMHHPVLAHVLEGIVDALLAGRPSGLAPAGSDEYIANRIEHELGDAARIRSCDQHEHHHQSRQRRGVLPNGLSVT